MDNETSIFRVNSEKTSFTRTVKNDQAVLEVELVTEIISAAGVLETRKQQFALVGDVAVNLLASLKLITDNLNNLVEKTTEEAKAKAIAEATEANTLKTSEEVEAVEAANETDTEAVKAN